MPPKPTRPPEPPDEDDYDSGDPYGCIAAGAAGVGKPTMIYRVGQCYEKRQPLTKLIQEDLASVKVALYDLWNSRIEPTAEHLDIIERIESIVTKLQTT